MLRLNQHPSSIEPGADIMAATVTLRGLTRRARYGLGATVVVAVLGCGGGALQRWQSSRGCRAGRVRWGDSAAQDSHHNPRAGHHETLTPNPNPPTTCRYDTGTRAGTQALTRRSPAALVLSQLRSLRGRLNLVASARELTCLDGDASGALRFRLRRVFRAQARFSGGTGRLRA